MRHFGCTTSLCDQDLISLSFHDNFIIRLDVCTISCRSFFPFTGWMVKDRLMDRWMEFYVNFAKESIQQTGIPTKKGRVIEAKLLNISHRDLERARS